MWAAAAAVRDGASLAGIRALAWKNGAPVGGGDLGLLPADLGEVVRRIADLVEPFGRRVRAGDRILSGAPLPGIPVSAGEEVAAEIAPLGRLEVRIA